MRIIGKSHRNYRDFGMTAFVPKFSRARVIYKVAVFGIMTSVAIVSASQAIGEPAGKTAVSPPIAASAVLR